MSMVTWAPGWLSGCHCTLTVALSVSRPVRWSLTKAPISLSEAIRRLSRLPAETLGLEGRGRIEGGFWADIAIFDPDEIADRAEFADPHRYAVGMKHVLVNGVPVLTDGEHTGARPGRALIGPGSRYRKFEINESSETAP